MLWARRPEVLSHDDQAFFHQMLGDCYRYIAEVFINSETDEEECNKAIEKANEEYKVASEICENHL
jgi:hypothetical protein